VQIGAILNSSKIIIDEWVTFVVELPIILSAKGYNRKSNGDYPALTESNITLVAKDGSFKQDGAYFDIAYAGYCKTWEEIAAIIDTDKVEYLTDRLQQRSTTIHRNEFPTDPDATLTNLSGTTWLFNSTVDYYDLPLYALNFSTDGSSNDNSWAGLGYEKSYGLMYYKGLSGTGARLVYQNVSGWARFALRTIHITGGADATNSALIEWLTANATRMI
jgi:hypothetical protein